MLRSPVRWPTLSLTLPLAFCTACLALSVTLMEFPPFFALVDSALPLSRRSCGDSRTSVANREGSRKAHFDGEAAFGLGRGGEGGAVRAGYGVDDGQAQAVAAGGLRSSADAFGGEPLEWLG